MIPLHFTTSENCVVRDLFMLLGNDKSYFVTYRFDSNRKFNEADIFKMLDSLFTYSLLHLEEMCVTENRFSNENKSAAQ